MSRRFQFSLRILLVVTAIVATFLGGMSLQKELDRRRWEYVGKGLWSPDGGRTQHELEPKELVELGLWDEDDILDEDDAPPPPPSED